MWLFKCMKHLGPNTYNQWIFSAHHSVVNCLTQKNTGIV